MKKYRIISLSVLLVFFSALSLWAVDFGLILEQDANAGGFFNNDTDFSYSASLTPRLSGLIGANSDFYISAGIEAAYKDSEWAFMPELFRTQLSLRSGSGLEVDLGRMYHSDPLGFVAEGLFDGVKVSFDSSAGTFSAGGWYTGFLYKKRIEIAMTAKEAEALAAGISYDDFADSYFATKRVIANLGWEHLSLGGPLQVRFAALAQFDLAETDQLNSQYIIGKFTLPVGAASFSAGGCFELLQYADEFDTALAAELGFDWALPTSLRSSLAFTGRYSSGTEDGGMTAFLPVTTEVQGDLLQPKLSGISMLRLDYRLRPHSAVALGLTSSYFIRTDLGTYVGYPVLSNDNDGNFLGNEFFARLAWSPVSDLQINLGGGVFLPFMGNVVPDAESYWRAELNVVLSLF